MQIKNKMIKISIGNYNNSKEIVKIEIINLDFSVEKTYLITPSELAKVLICNREDEDGGRICAIQEVVENAN